MYSRQTIGKFTALTAAVLMTVLYMSLPLYAFIGDEPAKYKINIELYEEFYKLMVDSFTNAKFEGVAKQTINGAYTESKYSAYSKDLDYKRIDATAEGVSVSHVTTPEKVWYYYEKWNYVIYYKNKKNVARFNSKVYFDSVKDDGKITKSVSDGQTTYQLVDYNYNIRQTFVFDNATRLLKLQIVEPEVGDKTETSYKGWEKVKCPKGIFDFPSRASAKCLD